MFFAMNTKASTGHRNTGAGTNNAADRMVEECVWAYDRTKSCTPSGSVCMVLVLLRFVFYSVLRPDLLRAAWLPIFLFLGVLVFVFFIVARSFTLCVSVTFSFFCFMLSHYLRVRVCVCVCVCVCVRACVCKCVCASFYARKSLNLCICNLM